MTYRVTVFIRGGSDRPPEDPSVPLVEAIFDSAATHMESTSALQEPRLTGRFSVWICACVSSYDAPTWLIYEDMNGQLFWCRAPSDVEPSTVVDVEKSAGGHADPSEVLLWLQGKAPHPWIDGEPGTDNAYVLREVRRNLLNQR